VKSEGKSGGEGHEGGEGGGSEGLFYLRFSQREVEGEKVFNCVDIPNTAFLSRFFSPVSVKDGFIEVPSSLHFLLLSLSLISSPPCS